MAELETNYYEREQGRYLKNGVWVLPSLLRRNVPPPSANPTPLIPDGIQDPSLPLDMILYRLLVSQCE
ncbi:unnamed protein product [Sphenostylis stenocarpa]|uniref:Uncharacterized protein n=1 Tax=Sphenostylis stenocarpa TaxID=92480 RepID=A0AA86S8U8_9FABA|nr:unnamed protein product [Sphenostylis stenocarpa]